MKKIEKNKTQSWFFKKQQQEQQQQQQLTNL